MNQTTAFIERLAELTQQGEPFASVTLVETSGSTPQDAGSKLLVTQMGFDSGTIGGGKVEAKAIEHAVALLKQRKTIDLVDWNLKRDVGMTCGGSVKLLFEAYHVTSWNIVIFGAGHVANALIRLLSTLDCKLQCIDPRRDWLDRIPSNRSLTFHCLADPKDFVERIPEGSAVLCMTMGHATDRPILEAIYSAPGHRWRSLSFIGAIGSKAKRAVLMKELKASGVQDDALQSLVCPLGLPIGNNHPAEIAISIAAQLLQIRDQRTT
jgi:xanthine dehydrogenase accessory factor